MIKVRSLSTIGGENIKTNVRRLFAYMFSTDLARAINWIGKGGKTAFSTLKIKDVLTGMLVHVPLILIKNNLIHKYLYTWSDLFKCHKEINFYQKNNLFWIFHLQLQFGKTVCVHQQRTRKYSKLLKTGLDSQATGMGA